MDEQWEMKHWTDLKRGDIVLIGFDIYFLHQVSNRRGLFGPALETTTIEMRTRSFVPSFATLDYHFSHEEAFWVLK